MNAVVGENSHTDRHIQSNGYRMSINCVPFRFVLAFFFSQHDEFSSLGERLFFAFAAAVAVLKFLKNVLGIHHDSNGQQ